MSHLNNTEYEENDDEFNEILNYHHEEDDEDDQHTQKVNGKIEALHSEIEQLHHSLNLAHLKNKEYMDESYKLTKENQKLTESLDNYLSSSSRNDDNEIINLKKKNQKLKDQLDDALSLAPDSIHPLLKEEFIKYCKNQSIYPELKDKDYNVERCIKILKIANKQSNNNILSSNSSIISNNDKDNSSLFSASEYSIRKIKLLENELKTMQGTSNDVKTLKAKLVKMNERIRIEKELKYKAENELHNYQKKIDMLSSHMDKLILHMKHEGAHKLRISEQLRISQKDNLELTEKYNLISSKSSAKDRLVLELREGSKILEDQLRLMDEKYMELRTKLDYARDVSVKKIKKAELAAKELRIKFAFANGSQILDTITLPSQYQSQYSMNDNNNDTSFDLEQNSWNSNGIMLPSPGNITTNSNPRTNSKGRNIRFQSNNNNSSTNSVVSTSSNHSYSNNKEPNMDRILEKIRLQQSAKQDWNDEKLRKLINK